MFKQWENMNGAVGNAFMPCAVPGCDVTTTRSSFATPMTAAAGTHMQALSSRVLALTSRLEEAEAELRRIAGQQAAAAPATGAKRAKR